MGQDYSDSSYKKSYAKDYVKSYKSGHVYIYEPPTVEKKNSKDSVLAEGRQRAPRSEVKKIEKTKPKTVEVRKTVEKVIPVVEQKTEQKIATIVEPKIEEIKPKIEEPKAQIIVDITPEKNEPKKEELPPLFDLEGVFNKKNQNADAEVFKYPIKHLHGTTYLDLFSGREINEERARDLLHTAGFTPKTSSGILPIFLSIIALFFFGYFGLVPIMLIGFWLFKKDDTTYTKMTNMEKLSFSMPATKYEMMIYKFQAIICFIVAAVSFIARSS